MSVKYQPTSHFFVDPTWLDGGASLDETCAFGPTKDPQSPVYTMYRTTSFVSTPLSDPVKVFAICKGEILILPQKGIGADDTKVNIILKPSDNFAPLKIKYFIYRGVNKSDLIQKTGDEYFIKPIQGVTSPVPFISKLWTEYISFVTSVSGNSAPTVFPAGQIGYDETLPDDLLIQHLFTKKGINKDYQIPICNMGEHIGYFTEKIGLDIVLDYGDYELTNQEQLFRLDLDYARRANYVFDLVTISNYTELKAKRYKEHIHQFLDAAAFWGSHIDCGKILTPSNPTGHELTNNTQIYENVVSKFHTRNKIYLYIMGERGRSYNFYDSIRKVHLVDSGIITNSDVTTNYETNGWPILIRETSGYKLDIGAFYEIDPNIELQERHVIFNRYPIQPSHAQDNTFFSYRPRGDIKTMIGQGTFDISLNNNISISNFFFSILNIKQEYPLNNYFNDLWSANLESPLDIPLSGNDNLIYWATYDRNRLVNLDELLYIGTVIQNKVIFDTGLNKSTNNKTKRRLYIAAIKENTGKDTEYNYNVESFSAYCGEANTKEEYISTIYNDNTFTLYKGQFMDGTETVNMLTLFNENDLIKKCSYFHLGITDDDFNKLIYDNPYAAPDYPYPNLRLPENADNVYFYLQEVTSFNVDNIKKYQLGLHYEEGEGGTLAPPVFAAPGNEVYVYTADGYFFFSKDYSAYQQYFDEFSNCYAEFTRQSSYNGEFGFDFMSDDEYKDIVGKLYIGDNIVEGINMTTRDPGVYFRKSPRLFSRLQQNYNAFPIQYDGKIRNYYVPILTLYPPYTGQLVQDIDLDNQKIFSSPSSLLLNSSSFNRVAILDLIIQTKAVSVNINLIYDGHILDVNLSSTNSKKYTITITCKKEFSTFQYIKVYETNQNKLIGILKVRPNADQLRKVQKVLLVPVKTRLAEAPNNNLIFDNIKNMPKLLRQILITPIFNSLPRPILNLENSEVFNSNYIYSGYILTYNEQSHIDSLQNFLKAQYSDSGRRIMDDYPDSKIIFFFDSPGNAINSSGNLVHTNPQESDTIESLSGGALLGNDSIALFNKLTIHTTTHELLHSLFLLHSFNAYECDNHGTKFTFDSIKTKNIMDYNPTTSTTTEVRNFLWDWQGKIARKRLHSERDI